MKYVDTHCHLDMVENKSPELAWAQLREQMPEGFDKAIHICCHPEGIEWALEALDRYPEVFGAFGIHPHDAVHYSDEVHDRLLAALAHPKAVAWGEIGLDYFYEQSPRDHQIPVFERQLNAAQDLGKPVVLHTREADQDTLVMLRQNLAPTTKLHVHCFTGSAAFAEQLLALSDNIWFGFTGIITFKNADNVRESLGVVPVERLLIETDAPFLAPAPHRGKTAHPGMIPWVAEKMAEVKQVELAALLRILRQNTKNVYHI